MEGNNVGNSVPEVEIAKDAKKKTSAERMVSYKDSSILIYIHLII